MIVPLEYEIEEEMTGKGEAGRVKVKAEIGRF